MGKYGYWLRGLRKTDGGAVSPPEKKPDKAPEGNPEEDQILDVIVQRARTIMSDWGPLFADGTNYIFGNQLANIEVKEGHSRVQDNQIFPAVTQEQALVSQNNVTIKSIPFEKTDQEGAKLWEPILQWEYEIGLGIPKQIRRAVIDAKTHGHWVSKAIWDARKEWDRNDQKWIGDVRFSLCRPETVIFAPDTEDTENPPWVIEFDRMRLDDAKREFPDFAEELENACGTTPIDDSLFENGGGFGNQYEGQPGLKGQDERIGVEGRLANLLTDYVHRDGDQREPFVVIERFFIRDARTTKKDVPSSRFTDQELIDSGVAVLSEDALLHAKTGQPITDEARVASTRKEDVPVYPSFRYVCRAGSTKLVDKPWKYKHHPYSIGVNLHLPHNWHGLNGVEMVRDLQDVNNRIAMNMEAFVRYFGLPIIKVEEGAVSGCADLNGVNTKIKIKPGAIWKTTPNHSGGINLVSPPSMPATLPEVRQMFLQSQRDLTGVQEIGLGRATPGGATATEAIRLETNTKLRTALQWKLVEEWIVSVMVRTQELCQENFEPGDIRKIVGPTSDALVAALDQKHFDARFDLRLEVATSMPFDRERRKMEAMELYKVIGIPMLEPLLDAYEREDKDEIMQKVQAYQLILEMMKNVNDAQSNATANLQTQQETQNAQA